MLVDDVVDEVVEDVLEVVTIYDSVFALHATINNKINAFFTFELYN